MEKHTCQECEGEITDISEVVVVNGVTLHNKCFKEPECKKGEKHAWRRGMHLDFTDKWTDQYHCEECNQSVSITRYRDEESMAYWA